MVTSPPLTLAPAAQAPPTAAGRRLTTFCATRRAEAVRSGRSWWPAGTRCRSTQALCMTTTGVVGGGSVVVAVAVAGVVTGGGASGSCVSGDGGGAGTGARGDRGGARPDSTGARYFVRATAPPVRKRDVTAATAPTRAPGGRGGVELRATSGRNFLVPASDDDCRGRSGGRRVVEGASGWNCFMLLPTALLLFCAVHGRTSCGLRVLSRERPL